MKVLMVGVDEKTKGGMWSVARGYLQSSVYLESVKLNYVPLATVGSSLKKGMFFAAGVAKIFSHLLTKKWDVAHIHMSERGSVFRKLMVASLARAFRCKVVLHLHGAEFEPWYQALPEKRKKFVKRGLNKADRVLILGEYWRSFISSLIEQQDKIKVLYNAVPVPEENRYRLNAWNLLFLGEVGERKGVYDLLDALSMIDEQLDGSCQLHIYGPNPDGDIEKRIAEKNLQHRARYMGWADKAQFERMFAEVAVNVLPSYHEGLPMTILETMAYGIPNITTEIAAIPEAVNEENGILIRPGDKTSLANAILCLMNDQGVRKARSEKAYETVKTVFSTDQHMREVIALYENITEREK